MSSLTSTFFRAKGIIGFAILVLVFTLPRSTHCQNSDAYAGSAACRECHPDAYALWEKSDHGLAERPVSTNEDEAAFVPPRSFRLGSQITLVGVTNGNFFIAAVGLSGKIECHAAERVIGNDPLRQFLISGPNGRWQAMEAAWDPHRDDWFDVFGNEDRRPGEWGHWTGRGMNWNSMCAACHNTALRKNYDTGSDTYHTTMAEPGVSCEACHGPLKSHVTWQKKYRGLGMTDTTIRKLSPAQVMDVCGSCHARQTDLTGDFKPGDSYFDHYEPAILDHSDLYYADGQVRDEDYEFTSFLSSRMCRAGVTCIDCHPSSAKVPQLQGNALCMRCHAGGYMKAPIINPEAHSHHLAGSAGDDCISCHMPVTVYMQRHPRHDHGLTIPDPLLTEKFGIPNACNRCHADKTADWALTSVKKWYGSKMERPSRKRAEWIALARRGDPATRKGLINMLADDNFYWQAVACGLLDQWANDTNVADALSRCLGNTNPLVRASAARSLEPLSEEPGPVALKIHSLLNDPSRSVRITAEWILRGQIDTNSPDGRELFHFLDINSDQPSGQMKEGEYFFARDDFSKAAEHFQRAVSWDPYSAPIRSEFAVALSAAGRGREAIEQLNAACQVAPLEAEYPFELGLAWNEAGNLPKAIESLQKAVELNPQYARAWYNLGLALNGDGKIDDALKALARAEQIEPDDAMIPFACATILAHTGRIAEAKIAARRALDLRPDLEGAAQLLEILSRQ